MSMIRDSKFEIRDLELDRRTRKPKYFSPLLVSSGIGFIGNITLCAVNLESEVGPEKGVFSNTLRGRVFQAPGGIVQRQIRRGGDTPLYPTICAGFLELAQIHKASKYSAVVLRSGPAANLGIHTKSMNGDGDAGG